MTSRSLRFAAVLAVLLLLGLGFSDAWARGRGGGGRGRSGGFGGGGGGGRGSYSRSGPAGYGSIQRGGGTSRTTRRTSTDWGGASGNSRSRSTSGAERSPSDGGGRWDSRLPAPSSAGESGSSTRETRRGGTVESERSTSGDSTTREGTYTGPGGESIEYSGTVERTDDGFKRTGSFESSTGASGSGSADVRVDDGRVTGAERSRNLETASGETAERSVSSERVGAGDSGWVAREGEIKTSTGIDAQTESAIKKTDDGFAAEVWADGVRGEGVAQVVRDGDDVYARGVSTDGHDISWGRMDCNGGYCSGGRVTADLDTYYAYPYYHYPYYYAYYSCPLGRTTVIVGSYGTPVYSCANTVVLSTTVSFASSSSGSEPAASVQATSSPVLMYELSSGVVVYATTYAPKSVYARKYEGRHYWVPGAATKSDEVDAWIEEARGKKAPTANATVITYSIGDRLVYLTNERPMKGVHAEQADGLYAWMPGVLEASDAERDAITTALTGHRGGGATALDAEVRKLQEGRPPPEAT